MSEKVKTSLKVVPSSEQSDTSQKTRNDFDRLIKDISTEVLETTVIKSLDDSASQFNNQIPKLKGIISELKAEHTELHNIHKASKSLEYSLSKASEKLDNTVNLSKDKLDSAIDNFPSNKDIIRAVNDSELLKEVVEGLLKQNRTIKELNNSVKEQEEIIKGLEENFNNHQEMTKVILYLLGAIIVMILIF